jgi:hypothetical protein
MTNYLSITSQYIYDNFLKAHFTFAVRSYRKLIVIMWKKYYIYAQFLKFVFFI